MKLHIWRDQHFHAEGKTHTILAIESHGQEDWADARQMVHVLDAYRMLDAVIDYGDKDAPYFAPFMGM